MDPKPQTDVDQIGDDLYDQMLAEESDYVREYNDVISYISLSLIHISEPTRPY